MATVRKVFVVIPYEGESLYFSNMKKVSNHLGFSKSSYQTLVDRLNKHGFALYKDFKVVKKEVL